MIDIYQNYSHLTKEDIMIAISISITFSVEGFEELGTEHIGFVHSIAYCFLEGVFVLIDPIVSDEKDVVGLFHEGLVGVEGLLLMDLKDIIQVFYLFTHSGLFEVMGLERLVACEAAEGTRLRRAVVA